MWVGGLVALGGLIMQWKYLIATCDIWKWGNFITFSFVLRHFGCRQNRSVLQVPFERKYLVNMQNKPFAGYWEGGYWSGAAYESQIHIHILYKQQLILNHPMLGFILGNVCRFLHHRFNSIRKYRRQSELGNWIGVGVVFLFFFFGRPHRKI